MNRKKRKLANFLIYLLIYISFLSVINETKIYAEPLSDVYFCVYVTGSDVPEFKFYFDKKQKVIKVIDKIGKSYFNHKITSEKVFGFNLYNAWGIEKLDVSLLGGNTAFDRSLNALENKGFQYGDILKISYLDYNNIKIEGNIYGFNGFNPELGKPNFIISDTGIEAVYTMPIILKGVNDIKIKLGSYFNELEGVSAISSSEGDLTNDINVFGSVDTKECGEYIIEYSVEDSYFNKVEALRKVMVIEDDLNGIYPELKINNHKAYFRSIDRKINKFIIRFDKEKKDTIHGKRRNKRG